jgi:CubicO group peptidase (beta-lactamase class C family)
MKTLFPVPTFAAVWALAVMAAPAFGQEFFPPPDEAPEDPPRFELIVPDDLRIPVCGVKEIAVHYPTPLLRTACETPARVVCDPPSGSILPIGRNIVTCSVATECGERATRTFVIEVVEDTTAPVLICPPDLHVFATDPAGIQVEYPLPEVRDDADDNVQVSYDPPSGSRFPIGESRVTCQATDACGNRTTCVFKVTVAPARLDIRATTLMDPTGGPARPAISVAPIGLAGLETAASLDGDWEPIGANAFVAATDEGGSRFYRPPTLGGVKTTPQGEIAYTEVGLLAAYANPGINPARGIEDASNNFATRLLAGDSGNTTSNLWSGVLNLPFRFHFFGRPYQQFRVSKNGLVSFSSNIINGREGLTYFEFAQAQITNRTAHTLPLWSRGFSVDNTIFGFAGRYIAQDATDGVWARVHGTAPKRQVWIVFRHAKDVHGKTTTAVVLEETSNRVLLMDMDTTSAGNNNCWMIAGIQGQASSTREVRQVPASPNMRLASSNGSLADNGCYLFQPYALNGPIRGQAAPGLMASTNLDLLISERLRQFNVPGMTVAISRNGRLIFNKGYGYANVELRQPMEPYHRACIGSVSKVLAAIGVEKLIDQDRIVSLDDWAYAPNRLGKSWFWDGVNQGLSNNIHQNFGSNNFLTTISNITVRHLLSHTAALANINDDTGAANAYANGDYTQLTSQQQVRWFFATQPLLTNGVTLLRQYSNPSFKQIGVLIEEVAGQKFENWMMSHVMVPAGVHHARLMRVEESDETWRDARRYHRYSSDSPWVRSRITGIVGPPSYGDAIYANAADGAAGSWTASAADLVRLMAAMDGLPNHPDILPPERFNELEEVAFPSVSGTQAIGWDSRSGSNSWVSKNGDIGYGSAQLIRSTTPDRLTVAVVANIGSAGVSQLTRDLMAVVRAVPNISPFYDLFPAQLVNNSP